MSRTILTFRASTMNEAMDLVRQELGPDAVVVESKEIAHRRLFPWSSNQSEIEISAERNVSQQDTEPAVNSTSNRSKNPRTVRTLAETMLSANRTRELLSPIPPLPTEQLEEDDFRFNSYIRPQQTIAPLKTDKESENSSCQSATVRTFNHTKSLEALQAIVARLEQQSRPRGMSDVPGELFQYYHKLVEAGVEEDIACELMLDLRRHLAVNQAATHSAITAMLTVLIEREMRCAPPIQHQQGRRQIVTLVGPTGVGKTTTVAKLATQFRLNDGLRVGLITIDTYRVGAIEQLQTYADILQIPLRTVSTPDALRTAIDEFDDVDLVLIDTAGRSPFDATKLDELRDILQAAGSDHLLLVLSIAAGPKMISKILRQFGYINPTSLVLTKLDETDGHGAIMSIAREFSYPINYLTTGQDVPEHFESAHPNRLARLILGLDQIH